MERLWAFLMQSPLAAWTGYVHMTRPSRKECEKTHKGLDERHETMCTKIDEVHKDVREIRNLMITHVIKNSETVKL